MNAPEDNPYAPPQAETTLDVSPFSLTYAQHILLWFDLVLMMGATVIGSIAAVNFAIYLDSNLIERISVSSRIELPAREFFFCHHDFLAVGPVGGC